jgi:phosphoglucosamine mutase
MRLFGTDGIRGVAGKFPLDKPTVRKLGCAAAKILKVKRKGGVFLLGRDTRLSGPAIAKDLRAGLSSVGVGACDLGVIPTPGIAYLTSKYPVLAGAVVSASHNPFADNGIKFFGHRGTKLPDSVELKIEKTLKDYIAGRPIQKQIRAGKSNFLKSRASLIKEYRDFLKSAFPKDLSLKGLKVVADCANGATVNYAAPVLCGLGAEVILINVEPNGTNINNGCGSLHPEKLSAQVRLNKADCGVAFDGDGDRAVFVDSNGEVRDGDFILALISDFWKRSGKLQNNTLVTTVMANLGLVKAMGARGINVVQTPVGDRYVFEAMSKYKAGLGGEQSGHIIFGDYLCTGDGILSALQVLAVMRRTGKPLSELCGVMTKYPQVLINTKVAKRVPLESLRSTSELIKNTESKLKTDGRVLVRYSGTENLLRVMIEGIDKAQITSMAKDISDTAQKEINDFN